MAWKLWYRIHRSLQMSVYLKGIIWEERGLLLNKVSRRSSKHGIFSLMSTLGWLFMYFSCAWTIFNFHFLLSNLWIKEMTLDGHLTFPLAGFMVSQAKGDKGCHGEDVKGISQEVEISKETEFLAVLPGPWILLGFTSCDYSTSGISWIIVKAIISLETG